MTLTASQLATLKAYIIATPALEAIWQASPNEDGANSITVELNKNAVPDFTVWKTSVPKSEVAKNLDGSELSGLTTAKSNRLQVFALWTTETVNPSNSNVRFLFDDVFSGAGGNITRPALDILWKRLANEIEKLFATGTGSSQSPATLVFEGNISFHDVFNARNS